MAKTYVGLGNNNKQISRIFVGKNGTNKKIYKAYVGTSGGPKLVFTLGEWREKTPVYVTTNDENSIYGTKQYNFDSDLGEFSLVGSKQTYYCSNLYSSSFNGNDYDRERVYTRTLKTNNTDDTIEFKVVTDSVDQPDGYQLYEVTNTINVSDWTLNAPIHGSLTIDYDSSNGNIVLGDTGQGGMMEYLFEYEIPFYNYTSDPKVATQTKVVEEKLLHTKKYSDFVFKQNTVCSPGVIITGWTSFNFDAEQGFVPAGEKITLDTTTILPNSTLIGVVYTFDTDSSDTSICTKHRATWEYGTSASPEIDWETLENYTVLDKYYKIRTSNWTTRENSNTIYTVKTYTISCYELDGETPAYKLSEPQLQRQQTGRKNNLMGYANFNHDEFYGTFEFVGDQQEFVLDDICDKDIYVYTNVDNTSKPSYIVAKKVKDKLISSGEFIEGEVIKQDKLSYLYDPDDNITGYTSCTLNTSSGLYTLSGQTTIRAKDFWNNGNSRTLYIDFANNDQTTKRWKVVESYEEDPQGGTEAVPEWTTVEDSYVDPSMRWFRGYSSGNVSFNTPYYGRWNVDDLAIIVEEHLDHDDPVSIDVMMPSSDGLTCTHSTATWNSTRNQYHVVVKEGVVGTRHYKTYTYRIREYNQTSQPTDGSTTYTIETYNIYSEEIQR